MGMAATKVYCLWEDTATQKRIIKMYSGYKLDKTTHVFKNEDNIEFVDAPSGLLIMKYETKNMSEAIRWFNADETLKNKLEAVRAKENYLKVCEDTKVMIAEYLQNLFKDAK